MNILITCHKPPGVDADHKDLFQLNTTVYKANKTRKNARRNLKAKGDTIYYIDTDTKAVPGDTLHWFPKWTSVPDNSMDLIWGHNCPVFDAFEVEELYPRLHFDEPEEARFLRDGEGESGGGFWRDVLKHGKRVLKPGGKIVIPFYLTWEGWISDPIQICLIARIINMEAVKNFLYKITVIDSLSEKHTDYLKNAFIMNNNNFNRKMNNANKALDLDEALKFLVFEKP